jgi:hypothetical protein
MSEAARYLGVPGGSGVGMPEFVLGSQASDLGKTTGRAPAGTSCRVPLPRRPEK